MQAREIRLKALLSLAIIVAALVMDRWWPWGVLFLYWFYKDLIDRQTWLSETIHRDENFILYFIILGLWLFLGLYCLSELLDPWPVWLDFQGGEQ